MARTAGRFNLEQTIFLVETAVLRCRRLIVEALKSVETSGTKVDCALLRERMSMEVRGSVANFAGDEYTSYYDAPDGAKPTKPRPWDTLLQIDTMMGLARRARRRRLKASAGTDSSDRRSLLLLSSFGVAWSETTACGGWYGFSWMASSLCCLGLRRRGHWRETRSLPRVEAAPKGGEDYVKSRLHISIKLLASAERENYSSANGANEMKKSLMFAALLIAMTGVANAHHHWEGGEPYGTPISAPEFDPTSALVALTLLAGAVGVLTGRRRR
jgi:hypothetical protein